MANVTEPSPIKPLWPVRRDRRKGQQKRPEQRDEKEQERHGEQLPGKRESPIIDDYA